MKKTLLSLLVLTFFLTGYSQNSSNSQYSELDKFVGTWTHEEAGNSYTIVLRKVKHPPNTYPEDHHYSLLDKYNDSLLVNNMEGYYIVDDVIVKA